VALVILNNTYIVSFANDKKINSFNKLREYILYTTIIKAVLISTILLSCNAFAEEKISIGLGIGASYSGIGFNLSQLSETDMKYVSAGCVSYSSAFGSNCGVGIGWINTKLLKTESNKHGIGGYIGIVGSKNQGTGFDFEKKPKYGVGVGYHYFLNGINKPGANVGFTIATSSALFLQWGYQF
jgi:hypothetical protein